MRTPRGDFRSGPGRVRRVRDRGALHRYRGYRVPAAGNAVDGPGEDFADARRGDGIARAGGAGRALQRERYFGGGEKGIVAIRHEDRAGMTAFAFDDQPHGGRSGDRGHDADRHAGAFEKRALLDVEFDEGRVVSSGKARVVKGPGKSRGLADLVQRATLGIAQTFAGGCIEAACEEAAAETADAEQRGLFGGEDQKLDGAVRAKAAALERADGFEAAEHADRAIVAAGIGNGVDVGSGADGGKFGRVAGAARNVS